MGDRALLGLNSRGGREEVGFSHTMVLMLLQIALAVPVFGGTAYGLLCSWAAWKLRRERTRLVLPARGDLPPVTILKPLCGMERGLEDNLRSTCIQDYPQFQVVISVQRPDDTALPIAKIIANEFGPDRVTVVVEDRSSSPVIRPNSMVTIDGMKLSVA